MSYIVAKLYCSEIFMSCVV